MATAGVLAAKKAAKQAGEKAMFSCLYMSLLLSLISHLLLLEQGQGRTGTTEQASWRDKIPPGGVARAAGSL